MSQDIHRHQHRWIKNPDSKSGTDYCSECLGVRGPKSGDTRNHGKITESGPDMEFVDPSGRVVYKGPIVSSTKCTGEVYCQKCGWIPYKGLFGLIACPSCNEAFGGRS